MSRHESTNNYYHWIGLSAKRTLNREFFYEMNLVVPRTEFVSLITSLAPFGKAVWPPFAVETMLRIPFIPRRFDLSDPVMDNGIHDVPLYCQFAVLDLGMSRVPAERNIWRFRHQLEEHDLSLKIMAAINATLAARVLWLKTGATVDAKRIEAPSSTKNNDGKREHEMRHAEKGNQCYFGMRANIGVDADRSLVHTIICTAPNVGDATQGHGPLHGQAKVVFSDAGYQGADRRPEDTCVQWQVMVRPGKRREHRDTALSRLLEPAEQHKASVSAKVEHPFRVIKRQFFHTKVCYRGLKKNKTQMFKLFALSNLWMARKQILQDL